MMKTKLWKKSAEVFSKYFMSEFGYVKGDGTSGFDCFLISILKIFQNLE